MYLKSSHGFAALALAAMSVLPLAVPAAAQEPRPKEAVIIVSGEANSSVAPDLAVISLGVVETKKTAREALDASTKSMADVLKALKAEGIAEKDLQTSDFSIQPQYIYPQNDDGTTKPPLLTGYTVTNMLTVRLRDLSKVGNVLDTSVTMGVNQAGEIRFANADPKKTIEAARREAMKDAIDKARTLASAAGVDLGRVVEITENMQRPEPAPVMRMSMAKEASDAVPIATGENTYSVTVNVTFAIKQ